MLKSFALPPGLRIRRGRLHYRFMVSGVEYTGSTGLVATERNLSAALRKMEQSRQKVEAGDRPIKLAPRRFSDAVAQYLDWKRGEHRAHPATAQRVAVSMVSLSEFLQGRMVHQITTGDVENYKAWRRSTGIKDITLRHDLHNLSGLLKYGRQQNWCSQNVVKAVAIPSDAGAQREHVVSAAEEAVYFAAAAKYSVLHDAARLILETGMRPDEVLSLRVKDIDLERGLVHVRRGKTKAAKRTLALTDEPLAILRQRCSTAISGRVFTGERGSTHPRLNPAHYRVLAKTKQRFTLYELRHTFATRMAEDGCPLPLLAAILGHGSLRTIGRYVHPTQSAMEEAMRKYSRSGIGPGTPRQKPVNPGLEEKKEGPGLHRAN